ncbi:MAG: hypothetical protein ACREID_03415, partial [Planctomycetota bacterium]
ADLSDAGLRIGFRYAIQVPKAPDVIAPVRTPPSSPGDEGDPVVVEFNESFITLNHTILPAPGDITAEPNLNTLPQFFIDEGIENGTDPCDRSLLPVADRDSPQVIDTDPSEGETGFGTITGIEPGLGTAFVRLDPITIEFSEPVAPWRIRPQNISIRNANLGGETFDLFFFFRQDRSESILQMTVFDADSAFDQASVPQGTYILSLTAFTDLAGNPLVNSQDCDADGTFQLSFSTVSSPALPTDIVYTFQDDDGDGHVNVGGLDTATNDPNAFPDHTAPFLGGIAIDHATIPSPSSVTTSANPGNVAYWTGREVRYDNGYDPLDPSLNTVPAALRLRGASSTAATAILAPIVGRSIGPSSPSGSLDGTVASAEAGKTDFRLLGSGTATLFTGSAATGPIVYHYNDFRLEETAAGRPLLTHRSDSIFPLVIFVEDRANVWGDIILDGKNGEFGFNGANDGSSLTRPPGGPGGRGGPGGGDGGNGGSAVVDTGVREDVNGQTGAVPVNVLGPIDELSEAIAGLTGMAPGGGGHYDETTPEDNTTSDGDPVETAPAFEGGGGAGHGSDGTQGEDFNSTTPGASDQGVGGKQFGDAQFIDSLVLASGGAGGGGGAADDDTGAPASGDAALEPNGVPNSADNGGGGGGGGGGYLCLSCGGDIHLGFFDNAGTPMDTSDDTVLMARIRTVGGRGGSTYATVVGDPPAVGDPTDPVGRGQGGGGGGGGGISLISAGNLNFVRAELLVYGKRGGNTDSFEGRTGLDEGGAGGGGAYYFADANGINASTELGTPFGTNVSILLLPDSNQDVLPPAGTADLSAAEQQDRAEMSGGAFITLAIYGDEDRERLFARSEIVTEFFDSLSDNVSYNQVRTLSNAGRRDAASMLVFPTGTIRVFLDTTDSTGGQPDLSTEQPDGTIVSPTGATIEVPLTSDASGSPTADPQNESRFLISPGSPTLGHRFSRVRIQFDLSVIGSPATLLGSFAPPGQVNVQIAPGNSVGNIDTAPPGVPAVADVRVQFTP